MGPATRSPASTATPDASMNTTEPRMVYTVLMENPPFEAARLSRDALVSLSPDRRRAIRGRVRGEDKHPWPYFLATFDPMGRVPAWPQIGIGQVGPPERVSRACPWRRRARRA